MGNYANIHQLRVSGYCVPEITKIVQAALSCRKKPGGHFSETRGRKSLSAASETASYYLSGPVQVPGLKE